MGKIWRAKDRFDNTAAQLQRFRREAEIRACLPPRNICRVFEFNEFEGVSYIAMEFVHGLTGEGRADVFLDRHDSLPAPHGPKIFNATGNLVADAQALQTYEAHRPRALKIGAKSARLFERPRADGVGE